MATDTCPSGCDAYAVLNDRCCDGQCHPCICTCDPRICDAR